MIPGVDVSNNNGTVDWTKIAAGGYRFGIVKSSEGVGFIDRFMQRNLDEMARVGMARGVYHYARPDLSSPEDEASFFIGLVAGKLAPGDLIALDLETGEGDLADWSIRWLEAVRAAFGFKPLFYSYPNFMQNHGLNNNERLALIYPLWYASYRLTQPNPPGIWPTIHIWQHEVSAAGAVPGVPGRCDLNQFTGDSIDQLLALGMPGVGQSDDAILQRHWENNKQAVGAQKYAATLIRDYYTGKVIVCQRGVVTLDGVLDQGRVVDDWETHNLDHGTLTPHT